MSKFQDDEAAEAAFHEYQLQELEEKHNAELWEAFEAGWESAIKFYRVDESEGIAPDGMFNLWLRETGRA